MRDSLFCPLRKVWVAALPEEKVRQALIHEMTYQLGYPMSSLALEKGLSRLPHVLPKSPLPRRRADLIVFAKDLHPQYVFYPLLLVECKSVALTNKVLRQLIGYNQFVRAYFIAAVNQTQRYLGYFHHEYQDFIFHEGLLTYQDLLKLGRSLNMPK
jgi:Type I restriction enzyme R protein N terminus (HSDR_N)